MHIDEFDYQLPEDLIAQYPADKREESKLMVLHKDKDLLEHRIFPDLLDYLKAGDCLVLNNSKVIPARLFGKKVGGTAKVEFLLVKSLEDDLWETMVKPGRRVRIGDEIIFSENPYFSALVTGYGGEGNRIVKFSYEGDFYDRLNEMGHIPLPPYIKREDTDQDKVRYQTVYSQVRGSVAAPTAGLHFTDALLQKALAKGVKLAYVTLHVGMGTFKPVKTDNIEDHTMHFEEYSISQEAVDTITETRKAGGRVIAVGTTSTRTLESAADKDGVLKAGRGDTGIFIYPGYKFKIIDGQLTNFHLPKSTLLMLVSAFYNREKIMGAYSKAVKEKYRFFSYGDAMLII